MGASFEFVPEARRGAQPAAEARRVLVTGAAGRIGRYFAEHYRDRYRLRLMVRDDDERDAVQAFGEVVVADITEPATLRPTTAGIDTVIHLAADPSPDADWDTCVRVNINGTYHVFRAALEAGCRRVVYASSIHAVSGYPPTYQVRPDDPPNPGDLYGVSKAAGEALGRYFSRQHGLSVICVRIGAFQPTQAARDPDSLEMMTLFASHEDLGQLLACCVDNDDLRFAVVHGVSDNRFNRLDLEDTKALLGYRPTHDHTELNPRLRQVDFDRNVPAHDERRHQADSTVAAAIKHEQP